MAVMLLFSVLNPPAKKSIDLHYVPQVGYRRPSELPPHGHFRGQQ